MDLITSGPIRNMVDDCINGETDMGLFDMPNCLAKPQCHHICLIKEQYEAALKAWDLAHSTPPEEPPVIDLTKTFGPDGEINQATVDQMKWCWENEFRCVRPDCVKYCTYKSKYQAVANEWDATHARTTPTPTPTTPTTPATPTTPTAPTTPTTTGTQSTPSPAQWDKKKVLILAGGGVLVLVLLLVLLM